MTKIRFSGGTWDGLAKRVLNDPLPARLTVPELRRPYDPIRPPTVYQLMTGGRAGPYYEAQN